MTLVFKINEGDGSLTRIKKNPTDHLISINIIVAYDYISKNLYVWKGRNSSSELEEHVVDIQNKIQDIEDIDVSNQVVVEEKQEPEELFRALEISRADFNARFDISKKDQRKTYEKINELKVSASTAYNRGQYDEAIENAQEIIRLAARLDNERLIREQNDFIAETLERKQNEEDIQSARDEMGIFVELLEKYITKKDAVNASDMAGKIKAIHANLLEESIPPDIQAVIDRAEKLYAEWKKREMRIAKELKSLKKQVNGKMKAHDFKTATLRYEQGLELVEQSSIPVHRERWQKLKKDLDKAKKKWDAKIEAQKERDNTIKEKVAQYQARREELVNQEKYGEALELNEKIKTLVADSTKRTYKTEVLEDYSEKQQKIQRLKIVADTSKAAEDAIQQANDDLDANNIDSAMQHVETAIQNAAQNDVPEVVEKLKETRSTIIARKESSQKNRELCETLIKRIEENRDKQQFETGIQNCNKLLPILPNVDQNEKIPLYQEILREFKELYQKKQQEEQAAREKMLTNAKAVESIIKPEKDVVPLVDDFEVADMLGELDADTDQMLNQLQGLLETQRVEIKTDVKSKSVLRSKSGEVIELNSKTEIQLSETKEDEEKAEGEKKPVKYELKSGFDNPFDEILEEAVLEDVIPYNFEVSEIRLNGNLPDKEPVKLLTEEGLQVKWELENIEPKQKVEIDYDLRRRVSRTIIIPLDNQLRVIKAHSSLQPTSYEGLYFAELEFFNNLGRQIQGLVIEDIIPQLYYYQIKQPGAAPADQLDQSNGALVQWKFPLVPSENKYEHRYQLLELYQYEELKVQIHARLQIALGLLDNGELTHSLGKFEELLNILDNYT